MVWLFPRFFEGRGFLVDYRKDHLQDVQSGGDFVDTIQPSDPMEELGQATAIKSQKTQRNSNLRSHIPCKCSSQSTQTTGWQCHPMSPLPCLTEEHFKNSTHGERLVEIVNL